MINWQTQGTKDEDKHDKLATQGTKDEDNYDKLATQGTKDENNHDKLATQGTKDEDKQTNSDHTMDKRTKTTRQAVTIQWTKEQRQPDKQ